ncbi:5-dehydro-4-deoxy-D-glucuronate isomerase [Arvimicrobium flavum]|uniref:5-dehydro-4-deoxy-D-glucuronate isomerase n=1 Tax=Arvimicrobium flavum TaxID=3393320 RepID=UPI00237A48C0|nr:5-dehydro-4-deoxy-D-glucuronate isomerase [Mesorhizobium shangrilense]
MEIRHAVSPREAKTFDTEQLREAFLAEGLFPANEIRLIYSHYDRLIVGGAQPVDREVFLPVARETGTEHFLDRREMVVVNIGGEGQVVTLTGTYMLARRDMLYLGRGIGPVSFSSADRTRPARFYLVSAPAHKDLPVRLVGSGDARRSDLGDAATASTRVSFDYVHPEIVETCQLVVGITILTEGAVWNSVSGNLHGRRSEACLYFGMRPEQRIIHFMGEPEQTRHLVVANEQAILSPAWSIRASVGTQNYAMVWASAGDNVDPGDIESVAMAMLR